MIRISMPHISLHCRPWVYPSDFASRCAQGWHSNVGIPVAFWQLTAAETSVCCGGSRLSLILGARYHSVSATCWWNDFKWDKCLLLQSLTCSFVSSSDKMSNHFYYIFLGGFLLLLLLLFTYICSPLQSVRFSYE